MKQNNKWLILSLSFRSNDRPSSEGRIYIYNVGKNMKIEEQKQKNIVLTFRA